MGNTVRNEELSIEEDLLQNSRCYSFEMAAKILAFGSNENYGKEIYFKNAPFFTVNINSFCLRGTEIEKITEENGKKNIFIERLSLAGLNAPLPSPYAELVYNRNLEKDFAFGSFLNAFNSRLLGISYQISKRRYLCLQADYRRDFLILKTISNFMGENNRAESRKMSRLSYLFWTKERSAIGLEIIVKYLFKFETKIKQLAKERIRNENVNKLGHIRLGRNFDLGDHFITKNLGISIDLYTDNYKKIWELLAIEEKREELRSVIRRYVGSFIRFSIFVNPRKVPPLIIKKVFLGRTSWIPGKRPDAARI